MTNFIVVFPFLVGIAMLIIGTGLIIYRLKGTIHTEGIITDVAKTVKKQSRVTMNFEAPIVKYKINGVEYNGISRKFFSEGVITFEKGKRIKIRVSKYNYRNFTPENSGGIAEKLFVFGGIFMIIANTVILLHYGG